jgi:copper chaperone NosL
MIRHVCLMLVVALLALSAGCDDKAPQSIAPQELTAETLGHYCQMNLLEHPGPKVQLFLEGNPAPLFFSQVRDAIAYSRGPEQIAPIVAVYVNDMGAPGATWDEPGKGNWIPADQAFYVLGSTREGGMGAPEAVPFGSRGQAEDFARREGGRVLRLSDITDDMVLAPVETSAETTVRTAADAAEPADAGDADFARRLEALPRSPGE